MSKFKEKDEFRDELGLSPERGDELIAITTNIMDQCVAKGDSGRTSHVLLTIAGRNDLSDTEKVICTFIFSSRIMDMTNFVGGDSRSEGGDGSMTNFVGGDSRSEGGDGSGAGVQNIPLLKDIDVLNQNGDVIGMIMAPSEIDMPQMMAILMTSITGLLRQMPKDVAKKFCKRASMSFARMAETGDIKL